MAHVLLSRAFNTVDFFSFFCHVLTGLIISPVLLNSRTGEEGTLRTGKSHEAALWNDKERRRDESFLSHSRARAPSRATSQEPGRAGGRAHDPRGVEASAHATKALYRHTPRTVYPAPPERLKNGTLTKQNFCRRGGTVSHTIITCIVIRRPSLSVIRIESERTHTHKP